MFRWKPGNEARYKKTIVCQEVAKAKNVCQVREGPGWGGGGRRRAVSGRERHGPTALPLPTPHPQVCLLDLEYGLPVQVRDQALGLQDESLPDSVAGKEYALNRMQNEGELDAAGAFQASKPNELLMKLQRTEPYYKRNRAKICSFFVKVGGAGGAWGVEGGAAQRAHVWQGPSLTALPPSPPPHARARVGRVQARRRVSLPPRDAHAGAAVGPEDPRPLLWRQRPCGREDAGARGAAGAPHPPRGQDHLHAGRGGRDA